MHVQVLSAVAGQLYEVRLLLLCEVLLWLWIVFPCLKQVLQLSDSDIPYGFAYRLPFLHHALPACPAYHGGAFRYCSDSKPCSHPVQWLS